MKNLHKNSSLTGKKLLSLSLAALLSTGSIYSACAADQSAQKPLTDSHAMKSAQKQTISPDYIGWNDPAMQQVAVFSGQALLRHLSIANNALTKKDLGLAKGSLTAARDFAESLKKMIPFMRITEEIKDSQGNILQAKAGYILDDMLPVYENLEQLELYAPELKSKVNTKNTKKDKASGVHEEELFEASETTVYLPVLYVTSLIDNALSALDRKNPDIDTAKVAVDKALNSLTGIVTSADVVEAPNSAKHKTNASKTESPLVRSELVRVKQSIAFAENLQKEARHDPKDIYASIKDALAIVDKLLNSNLIDANDRTRLETIKKAIQKINANVNDTAAYAEVRSLLEPITDNPGE